MQVELPSAVRRRIAQLQIKTKKLLRGAQAGAYITKRVGTGSEFNELRDYQVGDNVRAIDWKSSARSNKLIVRSYREDRNRTIILLVDNSRSGLFASGDTLKTTVIQELAIMMSFAAEQSRDRIGAIIFNHEIEHYIPLGSGKLHCAQLVHELACLQPASPDHALTSLSKASREALERFPSDALVILISDCISNSYQELLAAVAQRHELVVLRIIDPVEKALPDELLIRLQDPETGTVVESSDPALMHDVRLFTQHWYSEQELVFKKLGVDHRDIVVGRPYDELLIRFFAQRSL